jgi:hypothetical protein
VGFHDNLRVESSDPAGGSDRLGQRFGGVGLVKQRLPLQVAELDVITINDAKGSNPRSGEEQSQCRPSGAAANNCDARSAKTLLAVFPDTGEEHLSRVSFIQSQRDHRENYFNPTII